ncbi:cytochrome o ubiquinol oxidase subunit IV [Massilia sp. 9I]|uniref:cytochrome o ubiquinol oxidase subunit IV n=1 Tax=Massilia sp. 9I TaxID=2653152 RepID=UPI0012F0FE03|nr:cytochrome o ubiquinol oxidase subunit IV [Massilia sp. 9I]VXB77972.1 cytochrome o ubiquinol oxidase subunit IV [Massilia sp. 9I]
MSDNHHNHAHDHHGDHGHHGHDTYVTHYSAKDYAIGFVLSLILTAIPFWLVMGNVLPPDTTRYVILGFAAVQVVVQMMYFLHLNSKSENGWNMMATLLTIVLLVIVLSGSIWVMTHMNANMMPAMGGASDTTHGMHDMQ